MTTWARRVCSSVTEAAHDRSSASWKHGNRYNRRMEPIKLKTSCPACHVSYSIKSFKKRLCEPRQRLHFFGNYQNTHFALNFVSIFSWLSLMYYTDSAQQFWKVQTDCIVSFKVLNLYIFYHPNVGVLSTIIASAAQENILLTAFIVSEKSPLSPCHFGVKSAIHRCFCDMTSSCIPHVQE